jgi:hypothetical protein
MAWRRDPATGEWEMIDPMTPDPMTQSTTQQESDPSFRDAPLPPSRPGGFGPSHTEAGYVTGDAGAHPVLPGAWMPSSTAEGATEYQDAWMIPPGPPNAEMYQNEDAEAESAWVEAAKDRGSIVRFTSEGVFEVDPNTGEVIGRRPTLYRMN